MEQSVANMPTLKKKGVPSEIDEHVGKRLRQLRSSLGWSQEKLAEAIQITFQQVQKYERGINRISAGRLFNISKALEVPVSYFFEEISSPSINYGLSDNNQEGFGESSSASYYETEVEQLVHSFLAIEDTSERKEILKLIKEKAAESARQAN